MARRGCLVLAHLACRTPLSVSLSPIPATGLPALSGLSSFLPCDYWHLSTALSIAWTRRVIQFVQGQVFDNVQFIFFCLPLALGAGVSP